MSEVPVSTPAVKKSKRGSSAALNLQIAKPSLARLDRVTEALAQTGRLVGRQDVIRECIARSLPVIEKEVGLV